MTKQLTPQEIYEKSAELILKSGLKIADVQAIIKALTDQFNSVVIGQQAKEEKPKKKS